MVHLGIRGDEYSLTHALRPPAQVEIITEERELRVESAEGIPHGPAHQHAGRTHGQDIVDSIVLTLIVLA